MPMLNLNDILIPGSVVVPVKFDVNSNDIKETIDSINKKQDKMMRLKEIDKERLKVVVQL